jgi:hypothetical protein
MDNVQKLNNCVHSVHINFPDLFQQGTYPYLLNVNAKY